MEPPYYAVIFTSALREEDPEYETLAQRMLDLAARQPGYLGVDSVRHGPAGVTVSYWRDEASIAAWRAQVEHREAQRQGRARWYRSYALRVARVERQRLFDCGD